MGREEQRAGQTLPQSSVRSEWRYQKTLKHEDAGGPPTFCLVGKRDHERSDKIIPDFILGFCVRAKAAGLRWNLKLQRPVTPR